MYLARSLCKEQREHYRFHAMLLGAKIDQEVDDLDGGEGSTWADPAASEAIQAEHMRALGELRKAKGYE